MVDEIKALKELLDMGAITQEEYDTKKKELLDSTATIRAISSPNAHAAQPSASSSPEKSKVAAGLLAIFLGGLGIHKFYLGYSKEGLIMLMCSLVGALLIIGPLIIGIIALIEGVIYLTKSDADFDRIYVEGSKGWF